MRTTESGNATFDIQSHEPIIQSFLWFVNDAKGTLQKVYDTKKK